MFIVVGLLATAAISALMSRWAFWQRAIVTVAAAGAIVVIGLSGEVRTRGGLAWWNEPLWRNLLLYVAMLTGMMFRVVWDRLELLRQRSARTIRKKPLKPRFEIWDFVYPMLPSLALFQGVLWLAETRALSLQLVLLSFQNGFFWHALLARTKSSAEGFGAKT
jgi:hypothetical protein